MTDTPELSLLITTRNRRDELLRTLGIMLPVLPRAHEVVLFDDGSTDGTSEAIARAFPQVRLISSRTSVGYITARNRLMAEARGDLALTLDDDAAIVTNDFSNLVRRHFGDHPGCAVAAFRIYWGSDLEVAAETSRESGAPYRVNAFVGCGHVWRMDAWRSIPPYPAWFEFHGEENYAALQLLRKKWEVHYLPDVLVHHRIDRAARQADRSLWRYRRQLRAGIFLMLLFYPWRVLPRYVGYSLWAQIQLRLYRERNLRALTALAWVAVTVMLNAPRIARERSSLTSSEWAAWQQLPDVPIYWQPERTHGVDDKPS